MDLTARDFPSDFTWGAATAAYQIEGAVTEDGRGATIWDTFTHTPGATDAGETGDVAADHYHRYAEDVDLMAELGLGAYRFSIAWSRIIPDGTGEVNPDGVAFYRRLCAALLAKGITPYATLYHWDLPQVLQDHGGWANPDSVGWFADYAAVAKRELGDLVKNWATFNEPYCAAFLGHSAGEHAPGHRDPGEAYVVAHHLMLAHHAALRVLRSTNAHPDDRFGIVLNLIPAWPEDPSRESRDAAAGVDAIQNRLFAAAVLNGRYPSMVLGYMEDFGVRDRIDVDALAAGAEQIDYLGLNYYNINHVAHEAGAPLLDAWPGPRDAVLATPPGDLTEMGWGVEPVGLHWMLNRVSEWVPNLPIMIMENGAAYVDSVEPDGAVHDPRRIAYLQDHLRAVHNARATGCKVTGYFVWSLLDNLEWARGYAKRFGLIRIDPETQDRTIKDSGHWYKDFLGR